MSEFGVSAVNTRYYRSAKAGGNLHGSFLGGGPRSSPTTVAALSCARSTMNSMSCPMQGFCDGEEDRQTKQRGLAHR